MAETEDEKPEEQKPLRPVIRFEKRNSDIEKRIELNMPSRNGYPDIRGQMNPEDLAEFMRKLRDSGKDS